MKQNQNQVWIALGSGGFRRAKNELGSKVFRRSLYFIKPLKKGSILTENDIRRIRPGFGLAPKYEDQIIGRKLIKEVDRGEAVSWDMFENDSNINYQYHIESLLFII